MARNGLAIDDPAERLARRRATKARYKASAKGKRAEARYRASEKRQAVAARFRKSDRKRFWDEVDRRLRRYAVANAIRRGRLVPQPCEICDGMIEVHAHHPFGYEGETILFVWWLCGTHHRGMHRALKNG